MTYDGNSLILTPGTVSPQAIDAWFATNGPEAAKSYAPDKTYRPAPDNLGQIIVEECRRFAPRVANHDLIAADIAHESAFWQSSIVREKHNPSGLGAVNDNAFNGAVTFQSPREGVRATVAHMLSYAAGEGPWTASDPRYAAVKSAGWLGVAPRLKDLNGKWAFPGTTYGQQIASAANALVDFANHGSWTMAGDDSRFGWIPDTTEFGYPNAGTHGRSGKPIDYLIIHVTEGTDSLGWLNGGNGSSAHYLTHRDATPRAQMVAEADAAWTCGNRDYNERGINIEFERFARDAWTGAEYKAAAATCYPILKRHSIPLAFLGRNNATTRGIIGHEHVPDPDGTGWGGSTHHEDPGPQFDWARFMAELRALDTSAPLTPADPSNPWYLHLGNGVMAEYPFRWGFRGVVEGLALQRFPADPNSAALALFGPPLEEEWQGRDGRTYQRTHKVTLVYTPGLAQPWDVAVLDREEPLPERAA